MKKNIKKLVANVSVIFICGMLIFVRSFMGINLFGFRLGEMLVGASLVIWVLYILLNKKITKELAIPQKLNLSLLLIPAGFFLVVFLTDSNLQNLYIYKASSYVWTVSFFFVGIYFYDDKKMNKIFFIVFNAGLYYVYFTQIFFKIDILEKVFTIISDKYEPHKGSDIAILFILCLLFNRMYYKGNKNYFYYISLFSAAYLPFLYFKSRATFIAAVVFLSVLYFIDWKSIALTIQPLKLLLLIVFSFLLALQSVFWVRQSGIIKIYEARENVVSLVQSRTNTYVENTPSFVWVSNGRVYTADGNLDWRIQIWQDIVFDLRDQEQSLFGYGYNEIIPVMNFMNGYRRGLDGLNENVHNNWFNILARGGLFHLVIFLYFYYLIIKSSFKKDNKLLSLLFILPLMFVSFFDSSMENSHFPLIYYFFLGRFYKSNI
jgi:hypothetical protein